MTLVTTQPEKRRRLNVKTYAGNAITFHDATSSNRIGLRGINAISVLEAHAIAVPTLPNRAELMPCGLVVLRLSYTEFWVLDPSNRHPTTIRSLEKAAIEEDQVTRLYCQHSASLFILKGNDCAAMFAKVCAINLDPDEFRFGDIAQTSLARVSASIVRVDTPDTDQLCFYVLSDIASAAYLWEALIDAADEFE